MKRRAVLILSILLGSFALPSAAQASSESTFWHWFEQNDDDLFNFERDQERIFDRLQEQLHRIDPGLAFEFGPKLDGRREFVISAEGIRSRIPAVKRLVAAAPALARWQVIAFRPRREPFTTSYGGVSVPPESVFVVPHPEGDRMSLTVLIRGFVEKEADTYKGIAFLMLDQALGEFNVMTRVGGIEVQAPGPRHVGAVPIADLPKVFDAHFASRR